MNPLLLSAGIELIKSVATGHDAVDQEKVKRVLSVVDDSRPFWHRKTWWSMVVAVVIPAINRFGGFNLQIEEITAMISPLLLFILSEQWRKRG